MTLQPAPPLNTGHEVRVAAGVSFVWQELPPMVEALDGVPPDVDRLTFRRTKNSDRGLGDFRKLKSLWVYKARQETIEEISRLPDLEVLYINGITATSLEPLAGNRKLKRLLVIGGTKIETFDWVLGLPASLQVLFLECFTGASDIGPIGELGGLTALGIEGGMDTRVRIDTLEPLARLQNLRSLFLANAKVGDDRLAPLGQIRGLTHLECRLHFPVSEFIGLRKKLPQLDCDWIDMIEKHGSVRKASAAIMARIRGR